MLENIIKIFFSLLVILKSLFSSNSYNPYGELTEYTVGDGTNLKIAVLSDSQLPTKASEAEWDIFKTYIDNLHLALSKIKSENVDVIIYAGDSVHAGTDFSFNLFKSIYENYFPLNDPNSPILNIILGNHDYYPKNPDYPNHESDESDDPVIFQQRFEKYYSEKPFSHKVINGIHFINWSSENSSSDKSNTNVAWAKEQIELALKDDPTGNSKPIFVTTHLGPIYTCYGTDLWGNQDVLDTIKDYQNVISISGHSHYSIIDDKSIWQGQFTAIQTQSTSYIELEPGTENGSIPRDEYNNYFASRKNPMGYFVYINSNEVRFKRFSYTSDDYFLPDWVYPLPIDKKNFVYNFETREAQTPLIGWEGNHNIEVTNEISVDNEKIGIIKFDQPDCETVAVKYKVIFKNSSGIEKEYLFFSDFYLMPETRHEYIRLKVPKDIYEEKGEYDVTVWALDTWGRTSINYINDKIEL